MTVVDKKLDREERRREQRAGVEALEASGALDELYSMIDAGEVALDGKDGLIQQLIKARPGTGAAGRTQRSPWLRQGRPRGRVVPELTQRLVGQDGGHQRRRCRTGDPA